MLFRSQKRYIYGSFSYSEGLVYPSAMEHIVRTFEIPRHWKRIVAFDYGLNDNSTFIFGAVDERQNLLYIYKEIVVNNRNVKQLADLFKEATEDIPVGGYICPPLIDPKSGPKRDYDKKSLADHFLEYGISFISGAVNKDARIFRLNTYLETGRLKIMDCCQVLIQELREYKFKPKTIDSTTDSNKPVDKDDHCISALEWIVMELPADPNRLVYGIYNKEGRNILDLERARTPDESYGMWALSDSEEADTFYLGGW